LNISAADIGALDSSLEVVASSVLFAVVAAASTPATKDPVEFSVEATAGAGVAASSWSSVFIGVGVSLLLLDAFAVASITETVLLAAATLALPSEAGVAAAGVAATGAAGAAAKVVSFPLRVRCCRVRASAEATSHSTNAMAHGTRRLVL
jgi:hypothetical protein